MTQEELMKLRGTILRLCKAKERVENKIAEHMTALQEACTHESVIETDYVKQEMLGSVLRPMRICLICGLKEESRRSLSTGKFANNCYEKLTATPIKKVSRDVFYMHRDLQPLSHALVISESILEP